ncbi:MAG: hypothetical protein CSA33_07810 [Desulfobulbus propionicus]|nr:MAG: hypothetical protein CSA33_07810 [Desulfobulbus propionicus]
MKINFRKKFKHLVAKCAALRVKDLARIQVGSIFVVCLLCDIFPTFNTYYIVGSFFLWVFGYPIYFFLGEPGWE